MKKMMILPFLLIGMIATLVGCGTTDDTSNTNNASNTNSEEVQADDNDTTDTEQQPVDLKVKSVTYIGQVDPHTIEVKTEDGKTENYQLSEEARSQVESLQENAKLEISYLENDEGQLVIEKIEKTGDQAAQSDMIESTGTYIGQVDPHTVEIETAEGNERFQLSDEARTMVEDLNENDNVSFTYEEQEEVKTISSIKKQ
ncbi:hypothetical protein [Pseudalkalibacillus caeni]|uniref:Lipoprotein n=1 Tax=Exobacillus caeni TaxID=2574798 RepID=A0A5R9F2S4_9BACL|nr:hypothetical protein [Pseudalkalibacillus caeni]TLS37897.1 hypothetical protein FCL54_08750 [Pseudalkalibacillus caeni]